MWTFFVLHHQEVPLEIIYTRIVNIFVWKLNKNQIIYCLLYYIQNFPRMQKRKTEGKPLPLIAHNKSHAHIELDMSSCKLDQLDYLLDIMTQLQCQAVGIVKDL